LAPVPRTNRPRLAHSRAPDAVAAAIHPVSLHDALPIWWPAATAPRPSSARPAACGIPSRIPPRATATASPSRATAPTKVKPLPRSEEHTSELQSRFDLVCRLLPEKKNMTTAYIQAP